LGSLEVLLGLAVNCLGKSLLGGFDGWRPAADAAPGLCVGLGNGLVETTV
jgi:hypothetical protein